MPEGLPHTCHSADFDKTPPEPQVVISERLIHAGVEAAGQKGKYSEELPQCIVQGGLPRTIAAGLEILGIDPGRLRAPLAELEPAQKQQWRDILQTLA